MSRRAEGRIEVLGEVPQQAHPAQGAVGHFIQVVFHACRKAHVHQRGEMFAQLRADHIAKIGGREVLILQTHIFPVLNGGNDGGVCGGAAYAAFFKFTHQ